MASADKKAELEAQFEKLSSLASSGQHQKVLKAVEAILKLSPADADALKCKAVAQLHLEEYEDAWKTLGHRKLEGSMQFERAYCLYRLGRLAEALELTRQVEGDGGSAALELHGQLAHRLGDSAGSLAAFQALVQQGTVESVELKTNVLAAYVAAGKGGELPAIMASLRVTPKASFEVGYNCACGLLAAGNLAGAEQALRMALKQGEEALYDEDYTEEEVLDELAPLSVQLAYVLVAQGRAAEAVARLEPLVEGELGDAGVAAVAAINYVAASFASGGAQAKGFVGRSTRRLDALLSKTRSASDPLALAPRLADRLSAEQRVTLHLNRALLYLLSGKADAAAEVAGALRAAHPGSAAGAMLHATLLARRGGGAEADATLAGVVRGAGGAGAARLEDTASVGEPSGPLLPQLLRAQLALEAGDAAAAAARLGELGQEVAGAPGVVATRAALAEQLGDEAAAESVLEEALRHWQKQAAGARGAAADAAAEGVGWCLQRLVAAKLAAGKAGEALSMYQQLSRLGSVGGSAAGSATLARLARAAAASGDAAAAAALERELPGGPGGMAALVAGLDVDALEDSGRAFASVAARRRAADESGGAAGGGRKRDADGGPDAERKRKAKKRKPRLPKGYDSTKPNGGLPPPDPERWLPKWQRSDAKKKQKRPTRERRMAGEAVKGSQGAGKVDDALDRGARGEVEAAPAPPARPTLPARPKGAKGGKR